MRTLYVPEPPVPATPPAETEEDKAAREEAKKAERAAAYAESPSGRVEAELARLDAERAELSPRYTALSETVKAAKAAGTPDAVAYAEMLAVQARLSVIGPRVKKLRAWFTDWRAAKQLSERYRAPILADLLNTCPLP